MDEITQETGKKQKKLDAARLFLRVGVTKEMALASKVVKLGIGGR